MNTFERLKQVCAAVFEGEIDKEKSYEEKVEKNNKDFSEFCKAIGAQDGKTNIDGIECWIKKVTVNISKSYKLNEQDVNTEFYYSLEEELETMQSIQQGGKESEIAIEKFKQRLVTAIAKRYVNNNLSMEELIQAGNKGLVLAAKNFDESRGFKFICWVVWWVRVSIEMEIENDKDEYAKSKIPFLLHYFDFKVLMIIGVIMIFFSILTLFIPGDSPKYNDSAVMLLGIFFGIGLVFYSLIKFSFLINLKKRYEESNLVEIKKKILDLSIITDGTDTNNRYGTKVIGIKFLVEIDNDEVYLIYPTDHYRKYLKGVRGSFNLENELKKNINKNKEHKILYYDKAKIIKKFDFNINNFIKDYLERR